MRKSAANFEYSSTSTMNQFYNKDNSTYQSQQLGDLKGVVPIIKKQSRRARASSQPDNKNPAEQTSQNDIQDQNSNNNSGLFYTQMDYRRATVGTAITQSQTEMFDEHTDSHLFVETQPEKRTSTVDLPPLKKSVRRLKQIQQQPQRVEFNNLPFTQSSTKYLENKRNHSINLSDNFLQKTQPSMNMNVSFYEIGHNNSLNTSQIIRSKKTTPQKNLNKTTDSFYDANKNAILRKDPVLNLGIGQGFQIISELDSHRSSNKSLKPTKKSTIESAGRVRSVHHHAEQEEQKITRPKKKRHTQHEIKVEVSPEPERKAQLDTDMRTLVDALLGQYNETEISDEILKPKVNVKGLVDKMKGKEMS